MKRSTVLLKIFAALAVVFVLFASPNFVQAFTPGDLSATWHADWVSSAGYSGNFRFEIFTYDNIDYYAEMYIPDLGVFNQIWPVSFNGDTVILGGMLVGIFSDDLIQGEQILPVPYYPYYDQITWEAVMIPNDIFNIGPGPGPECDNLPPLYCTGSAEYCSELVAFDPTFGVGYTDYPVNGETWNNQFRSYLRRDLMQLIQYATAKVQCKTTEWDFGSGQPLGLVDMSEADGSIPGTSIGYPGHPPGTHMFGKDIDVAYYQIYPLDNKARAVCDHHEADEIYGAVDAYHCTSQPYLLDPWRTALFTTFLAEHPHLRVMGVDGQVGLMLEDSFAWLDANGWVAPALQSAFIPLLYEVEDQGWGFYQFHHHHMHISMNPVESILLNLEFAPGTVNLSSNGKYITAYIELVDDYDPGLIDIQTVMITVDGLSTLYADPDISNLGDYDQDGIPDLMVKFDRRELQTMLSPGLTELTLYGVINGNYFQGADTILVR